MLAYSHAPEVLQAVIHGVLVLVMDEMTLRNGAVGCFPDKDSPESPPPVRALDSDTPIPDCFRTDWVFSKQGSAMPSPCLIRVGMTRMTYALESGADLGSMFSRNEATLLSSADVSSRLNRERLSYVDSCRHG